MKRQGGFTLIELIVVMMILAILVAVAAPKFLNFQKDARIAALQGLKGAIDSGSQLVYGKAAIAGLETTATGVIEDVTIVYGYPTADMAGVGSAVTGIGVAGSTTADWIIRTAASGQMTITFKGSEGLTNALGANCNVVYTQSRLVGGRLAPANTVINKISCG